MLWRAGSNRCWFTPMTTLRTPSSLTGAVTTLEHNGQLLVVRLEAIQPPQADDADVAALREAVDTQAVNLLAQDLYQVLAEDIRTRAGVRLDQQALNAVHSNFHQ